MRQIPKLLTLWVFVLLFAAPGFTQLVPPAIKERHVSLDLRRGTVWDAIFAISRAGIPVGFEAPIGFEIDKSKKLYLNAGTLEEVLDSIVSQDPIYVWEIRDGVVNVFPSTRYQSSLIQAFLQTSLGPINASSSQRNVVVLNQIKGSRGLTMFLKKRGGNFVTFFQSASTEVVEGVERTRPMYRDVRIDEQEARSVLNKLILSGNFGNIWTVAADLDNEISVSY